MLVSECHWLPGLVALIIISLVYIDISEQIHPVSALQRDTSSGGTAERAIDGDKNNLYWEGSCIHTSNKTQPWWSADMGKMATTGVCEAHLYYKTCVILGTVH